MCRRRRERRIHVIRISLKLRLRLGIGQAPSKPVHKIEPCRRVGGIGGAAEVRVQLERVERVADRVAAAGRVLGRDLAILSAVQVREDEIGGRRRVRVVAVKGEEGGQSFFGQFCGGDDGFCVLDYLFLV